MHDVVGLTQINILHNTVLSIKKSRGSKQRGERRFATRIWHARRMEMMCVCGMHSCALLAHLTLSTLVPCCTTGVIIYSLMRSWFIAYFYHHHDKAYVL